jgi:hypothetical protein
VFGDEPLSDLAGYLSKNHAIGPGQYIKSKGRLTPRGGFLEKDASRRGPDSLFQAFWLISPELFTYRDEGKQWNASQACRRIEQVAHLCDRARVIEKVSVRAIPLFGKSVYCRSYCHSSRMKK